MVTLEEIPSDSYQHTMEVLDRNVQKLAPLAEKDDYYLRVMKYQRDYYNQLKYAQETSHEEGYEEGFEKGEMIGLEKGEMIGEKKGQIKTARKMKQKQYSVDLIMDLTGLTAEEIAQL